MVCRPVADSYRCRPAIMHNLCDRTALLLKEGVLVQTARGIGDNGIWCIAKRNGILYLPDVDSKTTSFSSAFAGIFASN